MVPGAGFEPAKLYAEDLESTPFDRSGTPACSLPWCISFLTIPLHLKGLVLTAAEALNVFYELYFRCVV